MESQSALREALVSAALAMLETDHEEPSLRAVARAAGVSAMAPYRHFPDKAALLAAVAEHGFEILEVALAAADDQPAPGDALFAQGMAYIAFAQAKPALFRLMFSHQFAERQTKAARATYDILAMRVASLLPAEPGPAIIACRALVHGIVTLEMSGRFSDAQPGEVAKAVRLFVDGLGLLAAAQ